MQALDLELWISTPSHEKVSHARKTNDGQNGLSSQGPMQSRIGSPEFSDLSLNCAIEWLRNKGSDQRPAPEMWI